MNITRINRLLQGLMVCAALCSAPSVVSAQADTAQAGPVFAEVNKQLPQMHAISFTSKRPSADYRAKGKAWAEAAVVRKIETTARDDRGDVVSDFYYSGAPLVFVFGSVKEFADFGNSRRMVARL